MLILSQYRLVLMGAPFRNQPVGIGREEIQELPASLAQESFNVA